MSVLSNPVWQEATQIYLIEGKGWVAYFYFLLLLAAVQALTLFLPSLDPGGWMGAAQLFKVSCVVALVAGVYFILRLVNQEYVPWRFVALKRWLEQERLAQHSLLGAQLTLVGLYGGLFILLSLPLLTWAAAIARAGWELLGVALVIIFGYFMVYGVWGLVALNLWELRVETRHIAVRFLLGALFLLTALLYLPLNSVAFLLAYLSGTDLGSPVSILGARPAPRTIHVLFHFLLLSCGIGLNRWLLKRKAVS